MPSSKYATVKHKLILCVLRGLSAQTICFYVIFLYKIVVFFM